MEYKELIASRHSVRRFTEEKVERGIIDGIIADALTAPSSKNCKSTGFMVIEDSDTIKAISEMRNIGSAFLAGAPAVIVVLGDQDKSDLWVDNASISSTFIMLSAVDRGLGSCWVHVNGRPRDNKDASKGCSEDYLRELLGVKENMRILCVIALGYEEKNQ